jgi:hypothetical protein
LFHNESLQLLDALVAAAVEEPPLSSPPGSPAVGSCYIVGPGPIGDWSDRAAHLAAFTEGGWRFIAPRDGMSVLIRSSGTRAVFRDGAWEIGTLTGLQVSIGGKKVLGARGSPIASPSGGSVIDSESRTAIGQILVAMREHGLIEL